MKNKIGNIIVIAFFTLLSGCPPYAVIGGKYTARNEQFTVELPEGWRQHNAAMDTFPISQKIIASLRSRRKLDWDVLRITKDGLLLQQIGIGRISTEEEFLHTKKKLSKGMLIQEVAGVISDDLRINPKISYQAILENVPTMVGGHSGFKLHYTYRTKTALKMEGIFYGTMVDNWLYYLLYEAAAQHYFDKDLATFEKMKSSFQINREASRPQP